MAVAGCINAYDCAGCYLTTLQQLQSDNIGVAINYTAPGEYGRRQLDYIKYTDKCGCTCCLTGENELRIVATQGVIKNFTLTNDNTNEVVNVKWNDLFGSNRAYTMVRYKTGSYPTSISDGTLAVKETTQNQYSVSGYNVSGLTDGTTYYFTAFAVSQDGTIIVVQNKTITPEFIYHYKPTTDSLAIFRNDGELKDQVSNIALTTYGTVSSFLDTGFNGRKYIDLNGSSGAYGTIAVPGYDGSEKTLAVWLLCKNISGWREAYAIGYQSGSSNYGTVNLGKSNTHTDAWTAFYNNTWNDVYSLVSVNTTTRYHICFVMSGTTYTMYVNGTQTNTGTFSGVNTSYHNVIQLGGRNRGSNSENRIGGIGEAIYEKKAWTLTDLTNYLNRAKKYYQST